ncbi:MAG: hypothetical protein AAGB00_06690 [Planctomycetota bacterium]
MASGVYAKREVVLSEAAAFYREPEPEGSGAGLVGIIGADDEKDGCE